MNIKIESGIPISEYGASGVSATLRKLQVGDSFTTNEKKRTWIPSAATRLGIKVTIRKIEPGVVRVWRIE